MVGNPETVQQQFGEICADSHFRWMINAITVHVDFKFAVTRLIGQGMTA
jgi:hypothetical protein